MKATLIAISIGAIFAFASHATFAAPTATTTQTGIGNPAYSEQTLAGTIAAADATIIQVGDHNTARDPASQTPGILQRNISGGSTAHALISQEGNEHAAAIVQDGIISPVNAEIRQFGFSNKATITQAVMTYGEGTLRQDGSDNAASLEQSGVADLSFQGSQTGSNNFMSIRDKSLTFGNSSVTQTGSLNSVSVIQDTTLGAFFIEQIGDSNDAASSMTGDVSNSIQQAGNGNLVSSSQADGPNTSVIVQTGDFNRALLTQTGGVNRSLITQLGNGNLATMAQTNTGGGTNTAYINQAGNGFVADITQIGGGNTAGIHQH